jgi:hypothetical protein
VKKLSILSSAAVAASGLLLCLVGSGPSYAATYSTSTAPGGTLTLSAIGDEIGSPYDQIILSDSGGSLTTSGDYKINTLQFVVGGNCYSCNLTPSGTISEQLTIDGVTQTPAGSLELGLYRADRHALYWCRTFSCVRRMDG